MAVKVFASKTEQKAFAGFPCTIRVRFATQSHDYHDRQFDREM
jgi:hypothetical protein